ncbi:MAG: hypothetical protein U0S48_17135 [Solirubrobacteraceae bacterium]
MPTFCRHNRFIQNCPICRAPEPPRRRAATPASGATTRRGGATRSARPSSGIRVRHLERAAEDGYASPLVPGLKATADAEALADELGFATGRLAELAVAPPGLYADAGGASDRDEGIWLALQTVLIGPLDEADDPFAALREAVVPWAGGAAPAAEAIRLGPRSPFADGAAAARGLAAVRAWLERQGGPSTALDGDATWTAQRRFDRLYERLGTVAGLGRARYDALAVLGQLGLAAVEAASLHAGDRDDATLAAKRVFGIGDRLLIDRRARDLAEGAGLPIAALDLALANHGRPPGSPRMTIGATAAAADADARELAAAALGVA